jgi:hypothetical protein
VIISRLEFSHTLGREPTFSSLKIVPSERLLSGDKRT